MSYFSNVILDAHQASLDGAGKMRTSTLTTLGDYKIIGFDKTLLIHTTGSGTGSYGQNAFQMRVTGSGQYMIRQSKKYHPYFSGKSQLIECTFDEFQPETNIEKRVGYFSSANTPPFSSSYDGFWLQSSGSVISLQMQNMGTQILNAPISQWNGKDASYLQNHDWTKFTVCQFDFLWLGGAILRLWVVSGGAWRLAHEYSYSGIGDGTFINSPNQPMRYEVRSRTATSSGSFHYICAQVATEGGFQEAGIARAVDTSHLGISMGTIGTKYPLKAIRKNSLYRDVPIEIIALGVHVTSTNDILNWTLELNPTLSAPLTYVNQVSSSVQHANGNGTITVTTSGSILARGIISQGEFIPPDSFKQSYLSFLGSKVGDEMDEYVLCVTPVTATVSTFGSIAFKEY